MEAKNMTAAEFYEAMERGEALLVDFWAPWCSYCRRIGPAYDKVAQQYGDSLKIVKINIDEEPELAGEERIEVIPTLVLYKNGETLGSLVAPESKGRIEDLIRENLGK